jgi:phosphoribosylanthranilate isomerase
MRVRVKICGITRVEDAIAAARSGADAVGFVFYGPSPRHVAVERAVEIVHELPPFITKVGLFVDPSEAHVWDVLDQVSLDVLQFHGDESVDACERFDKPYIKAVRMKPGYDVREQIASYSSAQGVLLDTHVEGVAGGTGQTFDWSTVPSSEIPLIVAGGLTPANVAQAIALTRPYAVDVSGGVESAKGIKDAALIDAFMRAVSSSSVWSEIVS